MRGQNRGLPTTLVTTDPDVARHLQALARAGREKADAEQRADRMGWRGSNTLLVHDEHLCGLCGFVAELEETAADGGDAKPTGQFIGAPWTINGAQAFLVGACIAIKLLLECLRRHRIPRVTECEDGPGRP